MNEFNGFPDRMQFTPLPNLVFSSLAAQINDLVELKVLLHIFELLYPKKGQFRYITIEELVAHPSLVQDLKGIGIPMVEQALSALAQKSVLLKLPVNKGASPRIVYFLHNQTNRSLIEKINRGEISFPGLPPVSVVPPPIEKPPDIFTLYEQNIGLITPIIADELKEAQSHYPEDWIREAVKEAVSQNKRNWKYIARILERWSTEGKKDGTHRGNIKTNTDPDKYIRGKYGHLVQR
jgi:DNA replication protein